jgi:hypothetical protein
MTIRFSGFCRNSRTLPACNSDDAELIRINAVCYWEVILQQTRKASMKAADLTTSFVVTVKPDATIEYAAQLMLQYRISGLPVTDSDGAVLGIVTFYLWGTTVVWQAIETAWVSTSQGGSYWSQHRPKKRGSKRGGHSPS